MAARRIPTYSNKFGFAPWLLAALALFAGIWLGNLSAGAPPVHPDADTSLNVYFSPNGGATDQLVHLINQAKTSVEVQAYSFTSDPIINALIAAKQRGVAVTIILDRSHLEYRNYRTGKTTTEPSFALKAFYNAGIPTYIDYRYDIAHNKIMLIDGSTIITGSFNYSNSAEHFNAENMLVIQNLPALYARYQTNFEYHLKTSLLYQPGLTLPATTNSSTGEWG
jgi:phosphatidylserine/phosphatidylglycerophosphate/cardiolipin synthase-like enzyme